MKKAPPTKKSKQGHKITTKHSHSNILIAQRARLLRRLKIEPVTTIQARHELDILAPAPRIYELRHQLGHNIQTYWQVEETPEGKAHRVALYVLLSGKYRSAKL